MRMTDFGSLPVQHLFGNLLDSLHGDAVALLQCQRMVRLFQLDHRSLTDRARMDQCLEGSSFR